MRSRFQRVLWSFAAAGFLVAVTACGAIAEEAERDATSRQAVSALYSAEVSNGTLQITGTSKDSLLSLRLQAGAANILEVDVGDDGSADFSFDRASFDSCASVSSTRSCAVTARNRS